MIVLFSPDIERLLGVGETLPPPNLLDIVRVVRTEAEAEVLTASAFGVLAALVGTLPEVEFVEIAAGLVDALELRGAP